MNKTLTISLATISLSACQFLPLPDTRPDLQSNLTATPLFQLAADLPSSSATSISTLKNQSIFQPAISLTIKANTGLQNLQDLNTPQITDLTVIEIPNHPSTLLITYSSPDQATAIHDRLQQNNSISGLNLSLSEANIVLSSPDLQSSPPVIQSTLISPDNLKYPDNILFTGTNSGDQKILHQNFLNFFLQTQPDITSAVYDRQVTEVENFISDLSNNSAENLHITKYDQNRLRIIYSALPAPQSNLPIQETIKTLQQLQSDSGKMHDTIIKLRGQRVIIDYLVPEAAIFGLN